MAISSWRCSPWLSVLARVPERAPRPAVASAALVRVRSPCSTRARHQGNRRRRMRLYGEAHVFEYRRVGKDRGLLVRAADAEQAASVGAQHRDIAVTQNDVAAGRLEVA
jgi:hypothetical protein